MHRVLSWLFKDSKSVNLAAGFHRISTIFHVCRPKRQSKTLLHRKIIRKSMKKYSPENTDLFAPPDESILT